MSPRKIRCEGAVNRLVAEADMVIHLAFIIIENVPLLVNGLRPAVCRGRGGWYTSSIAAYGYPSTTRCTPTPEW